MMLPRLTPSAERGERTITRCHEQLARRHQRREAAKRTRARYLAIERVVGGALCVIYISGVLLVASELLAGR